MTVSVKNSPFSGSPSAGGGQTEQPSQGVHEARIVALIDLGTHEESYQNEPPRKVRKCLLAFELDEEMSGTKGRNHVVIQRYNVSFNEKAKLYQLACTLLNGGAKISGEVHYAGLLGLPCQVQMVPSRDGQYVNVGDVAALSKKAALNCFKGNCRQIVWVMGDDDDDLPDYLPRVYGEEVRDIVARSLERGGSGTRPAGHVGADAAGSDEIHF